jgi:hypothetical protein
MSDIFFQVVAQDNKRECMLVLYFSIIIYFELISWHNNG